MKHLQKILILISLILMTLPVFSQKGTGSQTGIAREATNLEIIYISGMINEIKVGPCQNTMGRSNSGTHLIIEVDNNNTLNVHLGPSTEVSHLTNKLKIGQEITIKAFRTNNLSENNFIAKEIFADNQIYTLRDSNLRPVWAEKGRG